MEVINAVGRRKAAVARIYVTDGSGKITINKRDLEVYFSEQRLQFVVKQPLEKLNVADKYDIKVNLNGGGFTASGVCLTMAGLVQPLCILSQRLLVRRQRWDILHICMIAL